MKTWTRIEVEALVLEAVETYAELVCSETHSLAMEVACKQCKDKLDEDEAE